MRGVIGLAAVLGGLALGVLVVIGKFPPQGWFISLGGPETGTTGTESSTLGRNPFPNEKPPGG